MIRFLHFIVSTRRSAHLIVTGSGYTVDDGVFMFQRAEAPI